MSRVSDEDWEKLFHFLRPARNLTLLGWCLSYCVVIPLKALDLMPAHMSWLGILIAPTAIFSLLVSLFVSPMWLRNRWWIGVLAVGIICIASMLTIFWFERAK